MRELIASAALLVVGTLAAGLPPTARAQQTPAPAPSATPQPAPLAPPVSPPPAPSRAASDSARTAQAIQDWGFDPAVLVADGRELLLRAPDPAVDGLYQVLLDSAHRPAQAQALCALFDPRADRSLAGLNAAAMRFDPATQERYVGAVANLFVAATQNPPQPYDPAAAQQALKQAGVRAALLNDGFAAGLNGDDPDARCRSLTMLLDALQPRPLAERAAVTRLLLIEGLDYLADGALADRR